jgi:hypothetical protein
MAICVLICLISMIFPVHGATTELHIVRLASDGSTILNETTVSYQWMEANLHVYGDGITHYYLQGPVFVDDPDSEIEERLRWNEAEDTNVQEKDMGAVKGTNLKDLCDLVGGMKAGERLVVKASDGWSTAFAYKNVYQYSSREGPMVITWYVDGISSYSGHYPNTGYTDGMRLVWLADTSTNPWGIHAMGNWDWHEAAAEEYWYYYYGSLTERYPTTTGLSGKYISEILIYSSEAPSGTLSVSSFPTGAAIYLDGSDTGKVTDASLGGIELGLHTVEVRKDGYLDASQEVKVSGFAEVHLTLIPVSTSENGGGDGGSGPLSGYCGKELPVVMEGLVKGEVFLSTTNLTAAINISGGNSSTVSIFYQGPLNATMEKTHLCIFTSDELDSISARGTEVSLKVSLDNTVLEEDSRYMEVKGEGIAPPVVKTVCYQIHDNLTQKENHTLVVQNIRRETLTSTLMGAALLVIIQDNNSPLTAYFMAEGCDVILGDLRSAVSPEDAITTATFKGNVLREKWDTATLTLISTGQSRTDNSTDLAEFNDRIFENPFGNASQPLSIATFDVLSSLNRHANYVSVQSGDQESTGTYLENRLFLLRLTKAGVELPTSDTGNQEKMNETIEEFSQEFIPATPQPTVPLSPTPSVPPSDQDQGFSIVRFFQEIISSILKLISPPPGANGTANVTNVSTESNLSLENMSSCRYTPGDSIAWSSQEWFGKDEYQGKVVGRIEEIVAEVYNSTASGPFYHLISHPYYRPYNLTDVRVLDNVSFYPVSGFLPCSFVDNRTELWQEWVDWNSSFILDKNGQVSQKINGTGRFYLVEGELLTEEEMFPPPSDPLEFPFALSLQDRFHYLDEDKENGLSLTIEWARTMKDYVLWDENNTFQRYSALEGRINVMAFVTVYHLGHVSNTYHYKEYSPDEQAFRLIFNGYNYTSEDVVQAVGSGSYRLVPYTKKLMDRYEENSGVLLFTTPEDIELDRAYIRVDLGQGDIPIWRLA